MKYTPANATVLILGVALILVAVLLLAMTTAGLTPDLPSWLALIPGALGILVLVLGLLLGGNNR